MSIRMALSVAEYIVSKCCREKCPISNLQLQKILYYIQVVFLRELGYPCFVEDVEAWKFGPVVRVAYNNYCGYGAMPIYELVCDNQIFSQEEKNIVDRIVEEKRVLKPWQMVSDTHAEGKAWAKVFRNGEGDKHIIAKDLLKQYG